MHVSYKPGNPARQGFYNVKLETGRTLVAEWCEGGAPESKAKRWWEYHSDVPTEEKVRRPLDGVAGYAKATQTEVDNALKRELTEAEHIEASLAGYRKSHSGDEQRTPPIPPQRQLVLGQVVRRSLSNTGVVVGLHDDGQLVTVRNRNIVQEHGKTVDRGCSYITQSWVATVPLEAEREGSLFVKSSLEKLNFITTQLGFVVDRYMRQGAKDDPDYQRGYAWGLQDKHRFLESIFLGRDIGRFIIVARDWPERDEVLDGKQRINAVVEFMTSKIAYNGVFWEQLNWQDRYRFERTLVHLAQLNANEASRLELLEIFMNVNAGGVPQSEEHLDHVRKLIELEKAKQA